MKNSKRASLLMIMTLLFSSLPWIGSGQATVSPEAEKVVMIILNRADFDALAQMPAVSRLMDQSFLGLMNTRTSSPQTEYKAYATLGWGTRAEASGTAALFFHADEEKQALFQRRTGATAPVGSIVLPTIIRLQQQNQQGEYGALPGALGQQLAEQGLKTAVIGNTDTDTTQNRSAALITMDNLGRTPLGEISSRVVAEDSSYPFGIKTDWEEVLAVFTSCYEESSLLVVETGDLSRLEADKSDLSLEMYDQHKQRILEEIDHMVEKIIELVNEQTLLLLVAPYASEAALSEGARLTPLVMHQKGQSETGLLYSGTTRREGIVANIDLAPTILRALGVQATGMTGQTLTGLPSEKGLAWLQLLNRKVTTLSGQRYRVLYSFAVYEILATLFAMAALLFPKKFSERGKQLAALLLLGNMAAPFTLLVMGSLQGASLTVTYLLLIAVTAAVVIGLYLFLKHRPLWVLACISGLMTLGCVVDQLLGQRLIQYSLLGYDPIIGARYYGIGNEYGGILLGSSLVFLGSLLNLNEKWKPFSSLAFGALVLVMGLPMLGANVGGTITAISAYLLVWMRIRGRKIRGRTLVTVGAAVVAGVMLIASIDFFLSKNPSHLARTVGKIFEGEAFLVPQIMMRKLTMNLRLMGVTIWSRVLVIALAAAGFLFYRPIGLLKKIQEQYPTLGICWGGIVIACLVGFIVNDSGVVMAATAAIFLSSSILYLALYEPDQPSRPNS